MIHATDPTAAGLWQALGYSALPVTLDEIEPNPDDPRKVRQIIELARHAASGAEILRGGADHRSQDFLIRSCFLFSSINPPAMRPQDLGRLAFLELDPFDRAARPPKIDPKWLRQIGAALRRRIIDHWSRFPETLAIWHHAITTQAGHKSRGADQYATLLACADLVLYDQKEPASEELEIWGELLRAEDIALRFDDTPDYMRCIRHLLTSFIELWRDGGRRTIEQLLEEYKADELGANRILATYGMKVHRPKNSVMRYLYVANEHSGLAELFRNTHWGTQSGMSAPWVVALRRVPGAIVPDQSTRFDGSTVRYTQLPIDDILHALAL
jgi:hypothetical protein